MIRKLLAIAAVAATGLLAAPKAEAGHSQLSVTYRSGNASCGCPTYTKRFVRGYDRCRNPIFGYSRLALTHGSSCRHRAVQHRSRGHQGHSYDRGRNVGRVYGPRIVIGSRSYGNRGRSSGYRNVGRSYGYASGSNCR